MTSAYICCLLTSGQQIVAMRASGGGYWAGRVGDRGYRNSVTTETTSSLAPAPSQKGPDYDDDFYAWTQHQAAGAARDAHRRQSLRPRARRRGDRGLWAEASAMRYAARCAASSSISLSCNIRRRRSRDMGWMRSIIDARSILDDKLVATLRRDIEDHLAELYRDARKQARLSLQEFGETEAAQRLPEACPYTLDQILERRLVPRTGGDSHDPRFCRLRPDAAARQLAGRGAHRGQFRDQFRGRLGAFLPGRRRRLAKAGSPRAPASIPAWRAPRSRRRKHVRIRLAGRLVAAPSHLHQIPGAGDAVRLRQGARGQPAGGRGDRRDRLGHLRPRLSLDQAFRARRGRGARARSPPRSR